MPTCLSFARIANPPFELPACHFGDGRHRSIIRLHGPPHFLVGPGIHLINGDEEERGGRQVDQMTSSAWLPCVYCTAQGFWRHRTST